MKLVSESSTSIRTATRVAAGVALLMLLSGCQLSFFPRPSSAAPAYLANPAAEDSTAEIRRHAQEAESAGAAVVFAPRS